MRKRSPSWRRAPPPLRRASPVRSYDHLIALGGGRKATAHSTSIAGRASGFADDASSSEGGKRLVEGTSRRFRSLARILVIPLARRSSMIPLGPRQGAICGIRHRRYRRAHRACGHASILWEPFDALAYRQTTQKLLKRLAERSRSEPSPSNGATPARPSRRPRRSGRSGYRTRQATAKRYAGLSGAVGALPGRKAPDGSIGSCSPRSSRPAGQTA
jgi:hypothetical protein